MTKTQEMIKMRLESMPKLHTTTIAGKAVTRWSELYEISTWCKVENLGTIEQTIAKLEGRA